jgi:uncharacterized RDD family membrane protein YckC
MEDRLNSNTPRPGFLQVKTTAGMDFELEIAGMGARSYAYIIDWHIRILLFLAWLAVCGLIIFNNGELQSIRKPDFSAAPVLMTLLPAFFIYLLYHPLLEIILAGRTPGKRMAGVRLVNLQGRTPGAGAILVRNIFRVIDGLPGFYVIGLVFVGLTPKHQRIGDLAAGLVLVYDNANTGGNLTQISNLTLHSHLSSEHQTLLMDILNRWDELAPDRRMALARQFLKQAGLPEFQPDLPYNQDQQIKRVLQNLLKS